jgi:N-acetylglutamate synthase-like GNAT family acetyltransferase
MVNSGDHPINHSPFPISHFPLIRAADQADLPALMALIDEFVRRGDILPRSAEAVALSLPNWVVAELDGALVGMGSLLVYSPRLAEVRSLAVSDVAQGLGIGRKIVESLTDLAAIRLEYGPATRLFALTRAVPFFQRLGFAITEKEEFPEKIWHACRVCPIQDHCDEIAVVKPINRIPAP